MNFPAAKLSMKLNKRKAEFSLSRPMDCGMKGYLYHLEFNNT